MTLIELRQRCETDRILQPLWKHVCAKALEYCSKQNTVAMKQCLGEKVSAEDIGSRDAAQVEYSFAHDTLRRQVGSSFPDFSVHELCRLIAH